MTIYVLKLGVDYGDPISGFTAPPGAAGDQMVEQDDGLFMTIHDDPTWNANDWGWRQYFLALPDEVRDEATAVTLKVRHRALSIGGGVYRHGYQLQVRRPDDGSLYANRTPIRASHDDWSTESIDLTERGYSLATVLSALVANVVAVDVGDFFDNDATPGVQNTHVDIDAIWIEVEYGTSLRVVDSAANGGTVWRVAHQPPNPDGGLARLVLPTGHIWVQDATGTEMEFVGPAGESTSLTMSLEFDPDA